MESRRAFFAVLAATLLAATPSWAGCDRSKPSTTPNSRYVIGSGIVYDKQTNLTWQRCPVGQHLKEGVGCVGALKELTFDQAMTQGNGPWRLPSREELLTLVATNCQQPSINEDVFPDVGKNEHWWYWSSMQDNATYAWTVFFYLGKTGDHLRKSACAVRLVRDGR